MHIFTRLCHQAFGLAAIVALSAGCNVSNSGDQISVHAEPPGLAAAFERVLNENLTTRMGDVVAESGVPIGQWDRMYSFYEPKSQNAINNVLSTNGATWSGLNTSPHSRTQVFLRGGKVVYAYDDRFAQLGSVKSGTYATPESSVKLKHAGTSRSLEIESFTE
ncbi:hypothetical protein ACWDYH_08840 [Nocardia goodfellowii]